MSDHFEGFLYCSNIGAGRKILFQLREREGLYIKSIPGSEIILETTAHNFDYTTYIAQLRLNGHTAKPASQVQIDYYKRKIAI
jgi:hypothetical protein